MAARRRAAAKPEPGPELEAPAAAPARKRAARKRAAGKAPEAPAAKARTRGPKPKAAAKRKPRTPRGRGTRGPAPVPDQELKARGGRVPRAPDHGGAVLELGNLPPPPAWMVQAHRYAAPTWRMVVQALGAVLTELDAGVLARYCLTYALWRDAAEHLGKEGATVQETRADKSVRAERGSPWARVFKSNADQLHKLEQELGLTPRARMRLGVAMGKPLAGGAAPATGDQEPQADPYFTGG